MKTMENENLDWDAAFDHFNEIRTIYEGLVGMAGVNTGLALEHVFKPIAERFEGGERSKDLYDEMMSVE